MDPMNVLPMNVLPMNVLAKFEVRIFTYS